MKKNTTIIGAGLVGSLLSIYLAKRGHKVTIYERRGDMREQKMSAGRSINLAMSDRGLLALEKIGLADEIRKIRPSLQINVHADIASNPKNKSYRIAKVAQNYITGMGFLSAVKPDAWAAASIADKLTK